MVGNDFNINPSKQHGVLVLLALRTCCCLAHFFYLFACPNYIRNANFSTNRDTLFLFHPRKLGLNGFACTQELTLSSSLVLLIACHNYSKMITTQHEQSYVVLNCYLYESIYLGPDGCCMKIKNLSKFVRVLNIRI